MNWLEISVTTDSEAAEAVAGLFNGYGQGGAVVEIPVDCFEYELSTAPPPARVVVKTYLPSDGTADRLSRLEADLWHLGQIYPIPKPVIRELSAGRDDWAEAWKQQYHLLHIGWRIVIVPAWEEYVPAPGEVIIYLEPGMAFGTGLHPTTRLCLQALEEHLTPGCNVLDVGTGSGVLAIAAAKLGARSVLALDADPVAVVVAQENVMMNKVADLVTVRHGSLPGGVSNGWVPRHFATDGVCDLLDTGHFDLVLVNILALVIVDMAPALAARLSVGHNAPGSAERSTEASPKSVEDLPEAMRCASGGRLIAAGLIESQKEDVVLALQKQGLEIIGRDQEKDWVCLVAQRG